MIDDHLAAGKANMSAAAQAQAEQDAMRNLDADLHDRVRREQIWEAERASEQPQAAESPEDAALRASIAESVGHINQTIGTINGTVSDITDQWRAAAAQATAPPAPATQAWTSARPPAVSTAPAMTGVDGSGRPFINHPRIPRTTAGAIGHGLSRMLISWPIGIIPAFVLAEALAKPAAPTDRIGPTNYGPLYHWMMILWLVTSIIGFAYGYLRWNGHQARTEYILTPMERAAQDQVSAYRQRTWMWRNNNRGYW
jgi:hypothetical protein